MDHSIDIDFNVLEQLKAGNKSAYEAIFRKYNAKVFRFAQAVLYDKSLAEDITQDVFLSLWEHRKNIDPEKNFIAYLFTIAKNLVYDETKKMLLNFRYEDYVKNNFSEEDNQTEEKVDANSLEEFILQLIEKLPEARKKVFILHFTKDLSNKQIAATLSISEKNVEMQIRRSLDYIRKNLRNYIAAIALLYM
jgi:RNA polymerase sigma-70 factor (ECF subfamily)